MRAGHARYSRRMRAAPKKESVSCSAAFVEEALEPEPASAATIELASAAAQFLVIDAAAGLQGHDDQVALPGRMENHSVRECAPQVCDVRASMGPFHEVEHHHAARMKALLQAAQESRGL